MGILLTVLILAQFNTAQLTGTIRDSTGALLPATTVTAIHRETDARSVQQSDANGQYLLVNLPAGEYAVTVEFTGFKRVNQSGVVLEIGKTLRDFALDVGPIAEEVTVEVTVIETAAPLL